MKEQLFLLEVVGIMTITTTKEEGGPQMQTPSEDKYCLRVFLSRKSSSLSEMEVVLAVML